MFLISSTVTTAFFCKNNNNNNNTINTSINIFPDKTCLFLIHLKKRVQTMSRVKYFTAHLQYTSRLKCAHTQTVFSSPVQGQGTRGPTRASAPTPLTWRLKLSRGVAKDPPHVLLKWHYISKPAAPTVVYLTSLKTNTQKFIRNISQYRGAWYT